MSNDPKAVCTDERCGCHIGSAHWWFLLYCQENRLLGIAIRALARLRKEDK